MVGLKKPIFCKMQNNMCNSVIFGISITARSVIDRLKTLIGNVDTGCRIMRKSAEFSLLGHKIQREIVILWTNITDC